MFVRTERMFLRPAWPEDLDDIVQILEAEEIQCSVGISPLPHEAGEIGAFLNRPRNPRLPHFVMYLRAPNGPRLIGGIALTDDKAGGVELSCWIVARDRGSGYAREALRAVINQARSLGYHRVCATLFDDGPATHRVLESVGFAETRQAPPHGGSARTYVADFEARPWFGMPDMRVVPPAALLA